ncbi:FAD/NAD-P-binding domain-containing protein [Trametes elegans]|nr:FAD/NAD-P-binding domain-containing protein [Trametes elegans]
MDISGGGIGGLVLAVALSRYTDVQVDLYEAADRFREIGAGVMIWARTWEILALLGLADDFSRIAHAPPHRSPSIALDYRRSDQPEEGSRFYVFEVPYGCIRFHRAHFLDVLVDRLPEGVAHFGKRLVSYTAREGASQAAVELRFGDGSTAPCDVLVGCDGIKSIVRAQILQNLVRDQGGDPALLDHIEPVWSGTVAYRGLLPVERLSKTDGGVHRTLEYPMMYCGKNKHVVSYTISKGSIVNVVALATDLSLRGTEYADPWTKECSKEEMLDCYSGWEPEVVEMLQCIEKPTKWALHELKPLPFYVHGPVVLLGDAAHAMTPNQGAGAGQAIEDAFILAELLGHPSTTLSSLSGALAVYEAVRLPMDNHVLRGSRVSGDMYEFNGPLGDDLPRLGTQIGHQWDWLWETTPEGERERAFTLLAQKVTPRARL